jgi:hypothetical protein
VILDLFTYEIINFVLLGTLNNRSDANDGDGVGASAEGSEFTK